MSFDEMVLSELRCDGNYMTVRELWSALRRAMDKEERAAYGITEENAHDEIVQALVRFRHDGLVNLIAEGPMRLLRAKWLSPLERLAAIE